LILLGLSSSINTNKDVLSSYVKNSTPHILIIEDEPDINELLVISLEKNEYTVSKSFDGESGLKMARKSLPDLILLDLMLPGINGLDVCKLLKSEKDTFHTKIIMLTALSQENDIVKGLEIGADDYITKPFSIKVLNARIKSVLRRNTNEEKSLGDSIIIENIQITSRTRTVKIGKDILDLTFTEFQILFLLATHPGWVFTRYQIIDKIRGNNYSVTDRSVDFQIVGLRKKMGSKGKLIETIRGVGYRFHLNET
jgi:two-component system phosphate regulon response regulator PhoB